MSFAVLWLVHDPKDWWVFLPFSFSGFRTRLWTHYYIQFMVTGFISIQIIGFLELEMSTLCIILCGLSLKFICVITDVSFFVLLWRNAFNCRLGFVQWTGFFLLAYCGMQFFIGNKYFVYNYSWVSEVHLGDRRFQLLCCYVTVLEEIHQLQGRVCQMHMIIAIYIIWNAIFSFVDVRS